MKTERTMFGTPNQRFVPMLLKPRIAPNVALILGGVFISYLGFGAVFGLGLYKDLLGVLPGIFGLLGLLMACKGVGAVVKRGRLAIIIDQAGIRFPTGNVFHLELGYIAREDITGVSKHESMKGRGIEITVRSGKKLFIEARHYCEIDEFVEHCKTNGFPMA